MVFNLVVPSNLQTSVMMCEKRLVLRSDMVSRTSGLLVQSCKNEGPLAQKVLKNDGVAVPTLSEGQLHDVHSQDLKGTTD